MTISFNKKSFLFLIGFVVSALHAEASTITVTSPNGGELWSGRHAITWTSDIPSSGFVNIFKCLTDSCSATTSIQTNVPNTGSFMWDTVDLNEVTKVYIEDVSAASVFDTSDTTFKLDNSISSCNATIASNNPISSSFAKIGSTVNVNFDTCEPAVITLSTVAGRDVTAVNVGGTNWVATTSVLATDTQGDIPFSITYADLAGNVLVRTSTANGSSVTFDTVPPTLLITLASTTLTSGVSTVVTFTFSEPVINFTNANIIRVDNAILSPVTTADSGVTWTATLTPSVTTLSPNNSSVVDTSGITDRAGNSVSSVVVSPNYIINPASTVPTIPGTVTCKGRGFLMPVPADNLKRKVDTTTRELSNKKEEEKEKKNKEKEEKEKKDDFKDKEDSPFCFQKDLHEGVKNDDVKELQKRLISAGLLNSEVTGYFGSLTKQALLAWQTNNNFEATGEVLGVSVFSFQKDLYMGSPENTTSEVKELQKILISEGHLNVEATGYFGKITKKALIEWQMKNNLTAKGYLGPMSRRILNKNMEING